MNCMLFWQIIFGNVLLKSPEDIESHGSQPNCVALCQEKLPLKACGIFFPVLCARKAGSIVIFVFWSRITYVLHYILISHYFLLLLKVIELDQKS